jgi:hypothetical protein
VSPPTRSGQDLRLSPVKGIALSHEAYDLRGRDGYLICSVARAKAEQGIAAGTLELRMNSSGAYLAAVDLGYPPVPRVSGEQRSPFATIPIDRPDLDQIRRSDPERYANWRGYRNAHEGKGALGRMSLPHARPKRSRG